MTNGDLEIQIQEASEILADLKVDVAILQLRLAIKRFNPNQPRWPAGIPTGGQWKPGSGNGTLEASYDGARDPACTAQLLLDEELYRMAKSRDCWISSRERYDNCMTGTYIPKLRVGR